ncbi:unnamed protein product [Echinostoma caproni]|uniref:TauD domain-containing protein n=1 Tax=Echinostoma caproni TaxID=27848 RepID=A0A183B9L0_9TREM|nr:unnamed protein product [Echinostoma caproni]
MSASASLHSKCRNAAYPRADGVQRAVVPDDRVDWRVRWDDYKPISYTHSKVHGKVWADPDIEHEKGIVLKFNQLDGKVDRTSFTGVYQLNERGLPLNPRGRTGITGRGALGRWGPNHAADPIFTHHLVASVSHYPGLNHELFCSWRGNAVPLQDKFRFNHHEGFSFWDTEPPDALKRRIFANKNQNGRQVAVVSVTLRQVLKLRHTHCRATIVEFLALNEAFDSLDREALVG